MKRLQISIEEELDEALGMEAAKRQVSKAALIRGYVREHLGAIGLQIRWTISSET